MMVNIEDSIELCKILHEKLVGMYFPAVTGGTVYKSGNRKDIDLVIYRHRQDVSKFEVSDIEHLLIDAGLSDFKYFGFVTKCKWRGFDVDIFNPETEECTSGYGGEQ